jgi:hypothetical protein
MAIHIWSILCSKAVIDRETNQVSLHDVVESLKVELTTKGELVPANQKPALAVSFQFASYWTRSEVGTPEKSRARVILRSPSEVVGNSEVFEVDLLNYVNSRTILRIPAIPIAENGRHWFLVEEEKTNRWIEVSRVPLDLTVVTTPIEPQQATVLS